TAAKSEISGEDRRHIGGTETRTFTAIAFVVVIVSFRLAGAGGQARPGGEVARFEVTSLRAVRPTIQKLIADLQKKDQAAAKDDIEAFDAAQIGVAVERNHYNTA